MTPPAQADPIYLRCTKCDQAMGGTLPRHCDTHTCPWCARCAAGQGLRLAP